MARVLVAKDEVGDDQPQAVMLEVTVAMERAVSPRMLLSHELARSKR